MYMKLRLRLAKENIFISHLEFVRSITRALRRSGLPLLYTAGCHPRVKLSLSPALALGIESQFEYVDIELNREMAPGHILAQLNKFFPEGIKVLEIRELSPLSPPLTSRKCLIIYRFNSLSEECLGKFEEFKKRGVTDNHIKEISIFSTLMEIALEVGPEGGVNPIKLLKEIGGLDQEELSKVKIEKVNFKEI